MVTAKQIIVRQYTLIQSADAHRNKITQKKRSKKKKIEKKKAKKKSRGRRTDTFFQSSLSCLCNHPKKLKVRAKKGKIRKKKWKKKNPREILGGRKIQKKHRKEQWRLFEKTVEFLFWETEQRYNSGCTLLASLSAHSRLNQLRSYLVLKSDIPYHSCQR